MDYAWPGNVRELRNAVERMVVMAEGDMLCVEDVPLDIQNAAPGRSNLVPTDAEDAALLPLRDVERGHIERVLRRTGGNKKEAARILGIDRSTLYAKIKVYGLEANSEA